MSKLLTVFGATGRQGGAVIAAVLQDARLAKQYRIRGITRDASKDTSRYLQEQGVEIVSADVDEPGTLSKALEGSNAVFVVTATIFDEKCVQREMAQGIAMADAAVAAGAEFLIFSTLPNADQFSGGKYKNVYHFDTKSRIQEYIGTLSIRSTFIALGSYMQNLNEVLAPLPIGDGTYAITNCFSPETPFPLVDASDAGKWITAALAAPHEFAGKFIAAATRVYSMKDIVQIISKASGKTVRYQQVPVEVLRSYMPKNMHKVLIDDMIDMACYYSEFGYFGPKMKEMVEEGSQIASGKLVLLEEFLAREPPNLK